VQVDPANNNSKPDSPGALVFLRHPLVCASDSKVTKRRAEADQRDYQQAGVDGDNISVGEPFPRVPDLAAQAIKKSTHLLTAIPAAATKTSAHSDYEFFDLKVNGDAGNHSASRLPTSVLTSNPPLASYTQSRQTTVALGALDLRSSRTSSSRDPGVRAKYISRNAKKESAIEDTVLHSRLSFHSASDTSQGGPRRALSMNAADGIVDLSNQSKVSPLQVK
jgi:hypothetical protein